jgi:hypothetical protein
LDYRTQNRIAAQWLLQYNERKQSYLDRSREFTVLGAVQYRHTPTGTDISQPTQSKAISLVRLREDELWLMAVEDAESTLGEKKLAFLDIRRQAEKNMMIGVNEPGRPAWIPYVQSHYADWHSRRYGGDYVPSERTMRMWWGEIINVTVRIAIKRGAL